MVQYGQYEVPGSDKMVNFGVGQPSTSLLPLSKVKRGMLDLLNEQDVSLLQYGDIPGYKEFREDLAKYLTGKYSEKVNAKDLFVTNGVTGGLSLICSLFTNKDSVVFVEEPTYFLAINIFRDFGLQVKPITIENDGINLNLLKRELEGLPKSKNAFLYTIPTFHNPTSYTMSAEKRCMLAEISKRHNMLVIADEVYQLLYFDDADKPPLPMSYYGDNIISLGSFSKILAPSLRLGWIQTSERIMEKLVSCGQLDSSGGINPFISALVHRIINNGDLEKNIIAVRRELKERCETLCNSIESSNSAMKFIRPKGGYFLWIKVDGLNTMEMLNRSIENKVRYHSGNKFSAVNGLNDYLRLSFSYYNADDMRIGAQRLSEVIVKEYQGLEKSKNVCISVCGYKGKLGSKIVKELEKDKRYNVGMLIGREKEFDLDMKVRNVLIDVSNPEGTKELLAYLIKKEYWVPLLIGTTGDLPYELIKRYSTAAPVAVISNFSQGIPEITKFLSGFEKEGWNMSITEKHHVHKKDAPSGTAKTLARAMANGMANGMANANANANANNEIKIESIREGEIFGEHLIVMENANEKIEIKHEAKTRDIFSCGAINYIDWLLERKRGLYTSKKTNKLRFDKYSGSGNTFIIIDNRNGMVKSYEKEDLVKKVCDEERSVGSDGVIFLEVSKVNEYDFEWQYYNKDGSNVEMCGNGARAIAKYYYENIERKNFLRYENNFRYETYAIVNETENSVKVSMPKHSDLLIQLGQELMEELDKQDIIFSGGYIVGVPHLIFNVTNIRELDINKICTELIRKFSILKNFNLNFTQKNMDEILIRTYERGVYGETKACGSGCCAASVVYRSLLNSNEIKMRVSSGEILVVSYDEEGNSWLKGKVNKVFSGFV